MRRLRHLHVALGVALAPATAGATPDAPPAEPSPAKPPHPHYLRAALEDLAALAAGTTWYFIDDRNVLDWDNPSIKQRLSGEAWTFDNNGFAMNFTMHPFSGAAFYALPRGNDLSVAESFGYSFATSFLWEYVIEFKEKVSINDLVMTPGGGLVLGEFFHKLAVHVNADPTPGPGQRALGWVFGPTVRMHRAMDRDRRTTTRDIEEVWDDLRFGYAVSFAEPAAGSEFPLHQSTFRGELVSLPGFRTREKIDEFFLRADFTRLEAVAEYSEQGGGFLVAADTALLGWYTQRIDETGATPRGHSAQIAAHVGYRYRRSAAAGFDERLGVFHFPGPGVELWRQNAPVSLRIAAAAHPDFAGISAPTFDAWQAEHPDARPKSILLKQGYYYGWGWSTHGRADLTVGPVEASAAFLFGRYASQEGRDRTQDVVTDDVASSTELTLLSANLGVRPPGSPLATGVHAEVRRWDFDTGGAQEQSRLGAAGFYLEVRF
jgi:hypothetical protein